MMSYAKFSNFISINGVQLPNPSYGLTIDGEQLVDSARNALGQVVAQKINRRLVKLNNLKWNYLTADEWQTILTEIEKFQGTLTYYDPLTGSKITREVYWGNSSAQPNTIDASGNITSFINCSCNLIDMGY